MPLPTDIPPTAGLPVRLTDFLPGAPDFADALARQLGIPRPHLTCSGTAALIVALKTLAAGSARDTVIVPAFSCPLVVLAIAHCGLKTRLCDTARGHFDFDFAALEALADGRTLAILSTHLGGRRADVEAALRIARSVGAFVIEDAAQSLGARYQGQPLGLVGDIGFYSLAVGKGLTTYEGGVLFSRRAALHARMEETAAALLPGKSGWEWRRILQFIAYALFYRPLLLPYVYGIPFRRAVKAGDWVSAAGEQFGASIPLHALGVWRQRRAARALQRFPAFSAEAAHTARRRIARLRQIAGLQLLEDTVDAQGTWPYLMLVLPNAALRDAALAALIPLRLGAARLFAHALPQYENLQPFLSPMDGAMPQAQDFAERLLTLSLSPWLKEAAFERIHDVLRALLEAGLRDGGEEPVVE